MVPENDLHSKGERILLVENNRGMRHALKLYLELDEHQVHTAACLDELDQVLDGLDKLYLELDEHQVHTAACLDELDQVLDGLDASPSIVISDVHLGGHRHGSDAIERVRRRFQRQVPAILLTDDNSAAAGVARGTGIEMLSKPVDPQRLVAAVDELLARS
jgi:DNA-binding response OmpR family regulator